MRFEKARKVQNLSFLGVSWFIMWFFEIKLFNKFSHVSKNSLQNLKQCKGLSWKSDALYDFFSPNLCVPKRQKKSKNRPFLGVAWFIAWFFEFKFHFKFWHLLKCLFQNLTRCNILFQNVAHRRSPISKSSISQKHKKANTSVSRGNKIQTWIFEWLFFHCLTGFGFFKIQNLTRCKGFSSKSDALYFFRRKLWFFGDSCITHLTHC